METPNVIAWLLPSSTNQPALETVRMSQNIARRVDAIPSSYDPIIQTPNPSTTSTTIDPSVLSKTQAPGQQPTTSRPALELSFTNPPKNHLGFVLGTDPNASDIVLPKLPGIGPAHCHITFDAEKRLILRDTSDTGTAVSYDGNSNGDRRRESWTLSSGCTYGFPAMVDRVVIDIQSVRFQVVVNDFHLAQPGVYQDSVDAFMSSLASAADVLDEKLADVVVDDDDVCDFYYNFHFDLGFDLSYDYDYDFDFDMTDDDDEGVKKDVFAPLPSVVPPMYVKYLLSSDDGMPPETYLWNTARPWEPMVKVAC
ncbi:hypothetical protein EsH8_V_000141 [Colletotrichum jinshuiense]